MKIWMRAGVTVVMVFIVCGAFWLGLVEGQRATARHVRDQFRNDILVAKEFQDLPRLEYLKARYYYYSNRLRDRDRLSESDYGPVDEKLVQGYSAGKETSLKEQYEIFKKRRSPSE